MRPPAPGVRISAGLGTKGKNLPVTDEQRTLIASVVSRAPEWVRRDLSSTNPAAKQRAEDALAATIVAALRDLDLSTGAKPQS
jgi:hypothetical protein